MKKLFMWCTMIGSIVLVSRFSSEPIALVFALIITVLIWSAFEKITGIYLPEL